MIEMATAKPPFVEMGAATEPIIFKLGMFKSHPPIPDTLSDQCKAFILRCFEPDAQLRATADSLLKDAFILQ